MAPIAIEVNFDRLRSLANRGVRRASIFMGIGTNAVRMAPPISHVLDGRAQYRFVPDEVPDETRQHFGEEFQGWIISNGLRELIDTYSLFLTECFVVTELIENGPMTAAELHKKRARFEKLNISDEFSQMTKALDLNLEYLEMFETFRLARNCLSHRLGIITPPMDVNTDDGRFVLRWRFLATIAVEQDGTETVLSGAALESVPIDFTNGATVKLAPTMREKKFAVGSPIKLDRHDLGEICWAVYVAAEHVLKQLHIFTQDHGLAEVSNA